MFVVAGIAAAHLIVHSELVVHQRRDGGVERALQRGRVHLHNQRDDTPVGKTGLIISLVAQCMAHGGVERSPRPAGSASRTTTALPTGSRAAKDPRSAMSPQRIDRRASSSKQQLMRHAGGRFTGRTGGIAELLLRGGVGDAKVCSAGPGVGDAGNPRGHSKPTPGAAVLIGRRRGAIARSGRSGAPCAAQPPAGPALALRRHLAAGPERGDPSYSYGLCYRSAMRLSGARHALPTLLARRARLTLVQPLVCTSVYT